MSTVADIHDIVANSRWATTIGRVCEQFGGEVQTGPFGSQLHASDYSDEGTPVVMPQDMQNGSIVCDRIARVQEPHVNRLKQHKLQVGDVVFSRRGDVARFAVVTQREEGWLCGTGSIRIRLNSPDVLIGYVRRYLQQEAVGKWLSHHAKGVTMPNLNTSIVRSLPFVYPPLPEQRRIAKILDAADALRARRRAALAQLDTLTQSIFLDMFGDPKTIPGNVKFGGLGEFCARITDGTHQPPAWSEAGHPFLFVSNITSGEITFDTAKFISEETHAELTRRCPIELGDVLYSTVGSYGVPAVVRTDRKFAFQRHIAHIKPNRSILSSDFLAALLASPNVQRQADTAARGMAQKTVNLADIKRFEVFCPPLFLQKTFASRVSAVDKLKAAHRTSLAELDALFASLQHRAFRGEL